MKTKTEPYRNRNGTETETETETVNRRTFFKTGAVGLASLGFFSRLSPALGLGPKRPKPINTFDTPTFSAFVDTIVPGSSTDPTGAPGALEAGTLEYLAKVENSKLFPISLSLIHFLVTRALDLVAGTSHFCAFHLLNPKDRERVVQGLLWIPGAAFLLRLLRAPFYAGTINSKGFEYLGYPGPNQGYTDISFNEELSWSEPGAIDGNLP